LSPAPLALSDPKCRIGADGAREGFALKIVSREGSRPWCKIGRLGLIAGWRRYYRSRGQCRRTQRKSRVIGPTPLRLTRAQVRIEGMAAPSPGRAFGALRRSDSLMIWADMLKSPLRGPRHRPDRCGIHAKSSEPPDSDYATSMPLLNLPEVNHLRKSFVPRCTRDRGPSREQYCSPTGSKVSREG
jgi:hypothetical protein